MTRTSALALLAAISLSLAATSAEAQTTIQQMPLGGGWYSNTVTGPNGQSSTGTTMPLGGGWSATNWNDNNGHSTNCTTMPLGGGMTTTTCH